jgi:hypothetical protein
MQRSLTCGVEQQPKRTFVQQFARQNRRHRLEQFRQLTGKHFADIDKRTRARFVVWIFADFPSCRSAAATQPARNEIRVPLCVKNH